MDRKTATGANLTKRSRKKICLKLSFKDFRRTRGLDVIGQGVPDMGTGERESLVSKREPGHRFSKEHFVLISKGSFRRKWMD